MTYDALTFLSALCSVSHKQVVKMIFVVIVTFIISWLPLYAIFCFVKFGGDMVYDESGEIYYMFPFPVYSLNSFFPLNSANPYPGRSPGGPVAGRGQLVHQPDPVRLHEPEVPGRVLAPLSNVLRRRGR